MVHNIVSKRTHGFAVSRNSVIRKVSAYDLSQPLTLSWDGFMHSTLQFFLESPQPGPHPISRPLGKMFLVKEEL